MTIATQEAANLTARLFYTAFSKTPESFFKKFWKGAKESENVLAVQTALCKDFRQLLDTRDKYFEFDLLAGYFDLLLRHHAVSVPMATRRKRIRSITPDEVMAVRYFLFRLGSNEQIFQREPHQSSFNMLVSDFADFLLAKDTVENKTGFIALDAVINELMTKKSDSYFLRGYNKDLFVHDRIALHNANAEPMTLYIKKEYLSTTFIEPSSACLDPNTYHVFKVAA